MDYLGELTGLYDEIKEFEWKGNKLAAPKSLASLAWLADRAYLLYGLRLYVRWLAYGPLFPVKELGLREKDFDGLLLIVRRRLAQIEQEDVLRAYWRTAQLIDNRSSTPPSAELIKDHIFFLYAKADALEQEDYVDLLGYLNLCCTGRINAGDNAFISPSFQTNLFMIERKYGVSWKRGHTPLPYPVFYNLAISALKLSNWSDWREVRMHGLDFPAGPVNRYDWLTAYIDYYGRRVDKDFRKPIIAYLNAQLAFQQEKFVHCARELLKIKDMPLTFFGPARRRLSLMTYYELRYCLPGRVPPIARKLEPDLPAAINKLKANLIDLKERKDRLLPHYENLMPFLQGFMDLTQTLDRLGQLVPGSDNHHETLRQNRKAAVDRLADYRHESGDWLRDKWMELV